MLIELKNITKEYGAGQARLRALSKVTVTVNAGELLCLWGPSGSGKSTLLNILGLLDRPTEGTVSIDGKDVSGLTDNQTAELRNTQIGFIFQTFNLVPVFSALENVMLPLQIRGETSAAARKKAIPLLERVGLWAHMHRRPDNLSGGQRQRAAIARALVGNPRVVLADEPTANLDSETGASILSLLQQLNREEQTTFVVATHDPMLARYGSRHIHLSDGRTVAEPSAIEMPQDQPQTEIALCK
jgi:putative ABC transport system ATP-binding protein